MIDILALIQTDNIFNTTKAIKKLFCYLFIAYRV